MHRTPCSTNVVVEVDIAVTFDIQEAKAQLSKIISRVEAGEEVVITRAGKPVVKLSPFAADAPEFGYERGLLRIAEDFDDPLPPELLDAFAGR